MKTLVTHNGTFHADDVFAVATFILAHPEDKWQIIRSRDTEIINKADVVIDVGGEFDPKRSRFDHHQQGGAGVRENKIPYASFGLVWREFGSKIVEGDFFVSKQIDDEIVSSIDANDNGIKISNELENISLFDISKYIKINNLTWKEEEEYGDKADSKRLDIFLKLVDFATSIIVREVKRFKDKNSAYKLVESVYSDSKDKRVIIFDKYYPWQDVLINYPEPLIAIWPSDGGKKWSAAMVPKEKNSFATRIQFPKDWAGLRGDELKNETGVSDAEFCHNGRFLVVAKTKEGAISLANKAL